MRCNVFRSFFTMIIMGLISVPVYGNVQYHVELIIFERSIKLEEHIKQWQSSSGTVKKTKHYFQQLKKNSEINYFMQNDLSYFNQLKKSLIEEGYIVLKAVQWDQCSCLYKNAPLIFLEHANKNHCIVGSIRIYKTSLIFSDIRLYLSVFSGDVERYKDININCSPMMLEHTLSVSDSQQDKLKENQNKLYSLSEKRRLKFQEVHYFDHPLFGILLGVWPIQN